MAGSPIEDRQTLAAPLKERGGQVGRVSRHGLREEDLVHMPLNPMYGADLPPGANGRDCYPSQAHEGSETTQPKVAASDGPVDGPVGVGDQGAPRRGVGQARAQAAPDDPSTHVYENGETFGIQLGQHLSRSVLGPPPVPNTPRPGRLRGGTQPVAATGMRPGQAPRRDARKAPPPVPASPRPRPGGRTDGTQQADGGGLPQDDRSQPQPNPVDGGNQPPAAAEGRRAIWKQLREWLSLIFLIIALLAMVTLVIMLPIVMTRVPFPSWHRGLSATAIGEVNVTDITTTWQSSTELMTTEDVTSNYITTVSPTRGHGIRDGSTSANGTTSVSDGTTSVADGTKSVSDGTTSVADGTTSVADETTSAMDGTTPAADGTTSAADGTTSVADETTSAMDGTTAIADGTTSVADGTTSVADGTTSVADGRAISVMDATKRTPTNIAGTFGADKITFSGEGFRKLGKVREVVVSPDSEIWVTDLTKAPLQVYSPDGIYLYQFPPEMHGKTAAAVSFDEDGLPWVLMLKGHSGHADSVVQFNRNGHPKTEFNLPNDVLALLKRDMAVDVRNNHIFVTWGDGMKGGVQAFQPDGKHLWDIGPQYYSPLFLAVDKEGSIFVADKKTYNVYVYDKTGQYVLRFSGYRATTGGLPNYPSGICVDNAGYVLVVDSKNQRVAMFTSKGKYVRQVAIVGRLSGVDVGPGGQLVVGRDNAITIFPRY